MSRKQPLSKWLSKYQPIPGLAFEQKMKNAPWKLPEEKMTQSLSRRSSFRWQITVAFVLALLILSLSIPDVRASLSAWFGLSVAPSNQMPAASVTLVAVTPASPTKTVSAATALPTMTQVAAVASTVTNIAATVTTQPVNENQQPPEITQLSPQAGWNILAPTHLPEGYQFQNAYFIKNQKMVLLTYTVTRQLAGSADPSLTETKSITVLQAQKNDFIPMQIAPATSMNDVQVGGQPAAYAVGAWDTEFIKDENDPNGGKMVSTWRNDLQVQNLYWQVGDIYLVLVSDDVALSQQDMIDMAAGFNRP